MERGQFARICVEIDLSKPVVGKIWLRDHWHRVEYEGLHLVCAKYDCYGHLARNCPVSIEAPQPTPSIATASKDIASVQDEMQPLVETELRPTPPLNITPTISQGAAGVMYDLEKKKPMEND